MAEWKRVNTVYHLAERHYLPFALCGWHCIKEAQQWSSGLIGRRDDDVEFVFESGSKHSGELHTLSDIDLGIIPIFRSKRAPNKKCDPRKLDTPLQSSDFAAWQFARHFKKLSDISSESALASSLRAVYPNRRQVSCHY